VIGSVIGNVDIGKAVIVHVADARDLSFLKDDSFDLIITHPPYMDIIKYSEGKIPADLSNISSLPKFCDEIEKVAKELFRVLKPDRYCAILIGDTRKGRHFVPLAFNVMQRFLKVGFILKEDIPVKDILGLFKQEALALLQSVRIADYYKGKQIPAGYRGLTVSCFYRSSERTLTEAEISPVDALVREMLLQKFGAKIR